MRGAVRRGVVAGAVGALALQAVSYLDMAVRGRPASDAPGAVVEALLRRLGADVPGRGAERDSRRAAYGELAGIATGVGVGVAASLARALGVRTPAPVGAVLTGGAAMVLTDVPMALLGVSDPRRWTVQDWVADAVPHLAYGIGVQAVVRAVPGPEDSGPLLHGPRAGLLLRSLLLGVAAGSRSSLGLAAPVLTSRAGGWARAGAVLAVAFELVGDKLPTTPSRLSAQPLSTRLVSGAVGAGALGRRQGATVGVASAAGLAGAVAGSFGGAGWRAWADQRMPDPAAAATEDAVALGLAALACR